jgi:Zn-dependent M28 family amino/carboxypeptidase
VEYLKTELDKAGWETSIQETTFGGQPVRNVIAKRGAGSPWTVLGAHFDSRMAADQDPDPSNRTKAVPGANDGASGAAVLIELARSMPKGIKGEIWLVFFDSEDNGGITNWDWILGSRAFVAELEGKPDAAIIVDMIGDKNLNIYKESNSDAEITRQIWDAAAQAGYQSQFIPQVKFSMLDDHTPFLEAGIKAVDIIDFDYPFWHTTADTLDKISADSLEAVGVTVQNWLMGLHSR